MSNLGKKLKEFRKKRNLTQIYVEINSDLSQGTLSRIENGENNPTKETLKRIAKALNLNTNELKGIFEINDEPIKDEDYIKAINSVKDYLQRKDRYAIVLDPFYNIIAVSEGLIELFGLNKNTVEKLLPINFFSLRVQNNFGFRILEDEEYLTHDLAVLREDMVTEEQKSKMNELVKELSKNEMFKICWENSFKIKEPYVNLKNRNVKLLIKEREITLLPFYKPLAIDPRFQIEDYYIQA